jgi:chromosome segregation ATPase
VEKDNTISQLRKDQSELEKFKYVLDYKVKELKSIMEPKNKMISDLKREVEDIEKELDEVKLGNRELERTIDELDSRSRCLNSEILIAKKELRRWKGLSGELQKDVALVGVLKNPEASTPAAVKEMKKKLIGLHGKWILKTPTSTTTVTESDRMREYLENAIMTLKQQLLKSAEGYRQDSLRLKGEQAQLLAELNELREELLYLTSEKQQDEKQLEDLKDAIKLRRLELSNEFSASGAL